MRTLVSRKACLLGILAGGVIWLLLCLIPALYQSMPNSVFLYSLLAFGNGLLTTLELWRRRDSAGRRVHACVAAVPQKCHRQQLNTHVAIGLLKPLLK